MKKRRHLHWRVERIDGKAGFGAVGDRRLVTHFRRYFIESGVPVRIRAGWHGRDVSNAMQRLGQRYGFTVALPDLTCRAEPDALHEIRWPSMVELSIELPADWETYCAGLRSWGKRDLRRFRNSNLKVVRPQNDVSPERLRAFYYDYYVPSMVNMHGEDAYIHSFDDVVSLLRNGGRFFELWDDSGWIAAGITTSQSDRYYFRRLGWREGDPELRRKGVVSALYITVLRDAVERGSSRFFTGGVSPFFQDGLLNFKSKWGARLDIGRTFPAWRVWMDPQHDAVRWFFQKNSLILPNENRRKFDVCSDIPMSEVPLAERFSAGLSDWMTVSEFAASKRAVVRAF